MKRKSNSLWALSAMLSVGLFLFVFSHCRSFQENTEQQGSLNAGINTTAKQGEKQKGAHVFGAGEMTDFQPLRKYNLEWITLVSWGFQEDIDSPILTHHNGDSLQIYKSDSSWLSRIDRVRAAGFKVFLKPHVWINSPPEGKWRSDVFPAHSNDWEGWAKSYRNFIFRYARIAEKAKAEMFCIGAELTRLAIEKPDFWKKLIQDVREIYSGKITYAANWNEEYSAINFWEELDYIGIQAYFPLVKNNNPSIQEISKGWQKYLSTMKSIYKKYDRKVLFTEMGYKSTADSAIKPWAWVENTKLHEDDYSAETQANCYQAFFNTVWKKDWFAGVHIWQLRTNYEFDHEKINLDFTPRGKPAERIIANGFK